MITDLIIPALNEEKAIAAVLQAVPRSSVRHMIVVDNGSTDSTAEVARAAGATVVPADHKGYGSACLAGIAHLAEFAGTAQGLPEVVAFLDGDFSDYPEELPTVLAPIESDHADLVIGSRTRGNLAKGALTPQQRVGNAVACGLIRLLYGFHYTDLGPFRAIRWTALQTLSMRDPNFGWTAEMQVKAVRADLRVREVPVSYRPRIGESKISGTLQGSVMAGWKILSTVLRYSFASWPPQRP